MFSTVHSLIVFKYYDLISEHENMFYCISKIIKLNVIKMISFNVLMVLQLSRINRCMLYILFLI